MSLVNTCDSMCIKCTVWLLRNDYRRTRTITKFEKSVYDACRKIPQGRTRKRGGGLNRAPLVIRYFAPQLAMMDLVLLQEKLLHMLALPRLYTTLVLPALWAVL